ncbi:MAG: 50S ribosomal protein L23 [Patescibacteria group bacterium]
MGLFDRFKKEKITSGAKVTDDKKEKNKERVKKIKEQEKERRKKEEEAKKRQFQAVGSAATGKVEKKSADNKSLRPESEKGAGKKTEKGEGKKTVSKLDTKQAPRILIKPIISEKATSLGVYNQYVFAVSAAANKIEVKKAIKNLYGITPFKVNIINIGGKAVRYGRSSGRTKNWKKAVVTLTAGQKIDVYSS